MSSRWRVGAWWFEPLPRARVAWLRVFFYAFIFVDVFVTTSWVTRHGQITSELYHPLFIGRLLPLPAPTSATMPIVQVLLLVSAAIAATGRLPRLAGSAAALLYAQWMFFAFSYGKVDHDRVGFLIALAVLPTIGAASRHDETSDEASGWAIRAIQVGAVLTYFLSVFAKMRFGGLDWATGATLMRAVVRHGTMLGDPLTDFPWLLTATQWWLLAFELATPLLLVRARIARIMLGIALVFHAVTYVTIKIMFLPHVICLLAFLPMERLSHRFPRALRTPEGAV